MYLAVSMPLPGDGNAVACQEAVSGLSAGRSPPRHPLQQLRSEQIELLLAAGLAVLQAVRPAVLEVLANARLQSEVGQVVKLAVHGLSTVQVSEEEASWSVNS